MEEQEVQLFKELLRFNTMHPKPDLKPVVEWLRVQGDAVGLVTKVVYPAQPYLPVVIQTKVGGDPSLPAVAFNCHMDVVPIVAEKWDEIPKDETPFSAWEDKKGNIYARGSQDMKCVGAQYLCALRRLGREEFRRTIHLLWVPDEEIGGPEGMKAFVQMPEFHELNIEVAMDEGLASPDNSWVVFYGERHIWWLYFKATSPMGHSSLMPEGTAGEKIARVTEELMKIRDANRTKLAAGADLGDVNSININMMHGGVTTDGGKTYALNVIPAEMRVGVDMRVTYDDYEKMEEMLHTVACKHGVELERVVTSKKCGFSDVSDASPWWQCISKTLGSWDAKIHKTIFPAATDARYLRQVGVQAYGFSPMRHTPVLLHCHNEYLNRKTFIEGISIYVELIRNLANTPATNDSSRPKL